MSNEEQTNKIYTGTEFKKGRVNSFAAGLAIGVLLGVAIIVGVVALAIMFA